VALAVVAAAGGGARTAGATAIPARAGFDYVGTFSNVPSAPPDTHPIGGTADMVVTTRATTTGISATGLDPRNVYIADVHNQPCFIDEGGGRFLFDPNGPPVPPNAIWLWPITVTASGRGTATTTSAAPAGPRAKSVVIHLKRAAGPKRMRPIRRNWPAPTSPGSPADRQSPGTSAAAANRQWHTAEAPVEQPDRRAAARLRSTRPEPIARWP